MSAMKQRILPVCASLSCESSSEQVDSLTDANRPCYSCNGYKLYSFPKLTTSFLRRWPVKDMLSLPLVLLSLHTLAVYSAPPFNSDDVAVLRRGGTIHGLTLRREEYHQLQKRAVSICGVSARDASNSDCTKRYPSNLSKRGRSSKKKPGYYTENSGSSSGQGSSSPSGYTQQTSSTQQRQDLQDDEDMEEYENQHASGNHCDHLVELQTASAVLHSYCTNPGISQNRATDIVRLLNDRNKNLYLIRGDVNLAKGAATKRALLRTRDGRPLAYASRFEQSTWIGVVQYLEAKESVARTNAVSIKTASGLSQNVDTTIHDIYRDTLAVARAMRDSFVSSQQSSQQGSQSGSQQGSQGGNSPHHSDSSTGNSDLSDVQTTEVTYNNRSLTLYWVHNAWHYVYYYNDVGSYIAYTDENLAQYPPAYE
ncbi:hypothetical protein DFS33DRAFT_1326646 [Desarmillaria ectypa]|nr:hypothetical protein DFS33DRAFT_1326646 [Desarmillaria ectypa]